MNDVEKKRTRNLKIPVLSVCVGFSSFLGGIGTSWLLGRLFCDCQSFQEAPAYPFPRLEPQQSADCLGQHGPRNCSAMSSHYSCADHVHVV